MNVPHRIRRSLHTIKERRQTDIGRVRLPAIGVSPINLNRFPFRRAFKHFGILFMEHSGRHLLNGSGDFLRIWPDIFQVNGIAFSVMT